MYEKIVIDNKWYIHHTHTHTHTHTRTYTIHPKVPSGNQTSVVIWTTMMKMCYECLNSLQFLCCAYMETEVHVQLH